MADVFRILDRYRITGREIIYNVKNYAHSDIRIGDILYDLHGNRFKVKDIEMCKDIPDRMKIEDSCSSLL